MKCPHCEYKYGWDNETMDTVEGEHGDFYSLPVKMEKHAPLGDWRGDKQANLYACPSCGIAFIVP